MEKRTKESKKRMNSLILLIAFTAIMLIISTYAWFTSQKDITLSNLRGTVEVAENMEISLDAKTWHQKIDLSEAANTFRIAQKSRDDAQDTEGNKVTTLSYILPTTLDPVSGFGQIGSKQERENDGSYTVTGDLLDVLPLYKGKASSTKLENIAQCNDTETKAVTDQGYFAFDIYIKNTTVDGRDTTLQLNLNSAVQVLAEDIVKTALINGVNTSKTYKGDAASGLQNTVRVGLALYNQVASSTDTQIDILKKTESETDNGVKDIAIWEPNANDHVEYIVENNNKLVNGASDIDDFGSSAPVDTYAINGKATSLENVYNIADTGVTKQVTCRTQKTADNNYKINTSGDVVGAGRAGKPINLTNTRGEEFKITSNTVSKLRVYIWLEGQDVDCINVASQGGGIDLDLGLTRDDFIGEVMATN